MNDGAASEGPVDGGCMTCWEAIEVIPALGGRLDYILPGMEVQEKGPELKSQRVLDGLCHLLAV